MRCQARGCADFLVAVMVVSRIGKAVRLAEG